MWAERRSLCVFETRPDARTSGGAISDDVRRVQDPEGEVGADGGGGDEEQQAEPAVEPCSGRSGVGRRRLCARTASTVEAL